MPKLEMLSDDFNPFDVILREGSFPYQVQPFYRIADGKKLRYYNDFRRIISFRERSEMPRESPLVVTYKKTIFFNCNLINMCIANPALTSVAFLVSVLSNKAQSGAPISN